MRDCISIVGLVLALVGFALAPAAQPFGTDMFVGDDQGNVYRVTPTGQITTLGDFAPTGTVMWDLKLDADDRRLVASLAVGGLSSGSLATIDIASAVATTISSGIGAFLTNLDENGNYVVSTRAGVFTIDRNGQRIGTVFAGGGVPLADRDVTTGNWIVADGLNVLHYEPTMQRTVQTQTVTFSNHYTIFCDPTAAEAYLLTTTLHRIDLTNGFVTTVAGSLLIRSAGDQVIAMDRPTSATPPSLFVHNTVNSINTVHEMDRNGTMIRSISPFAGQVTGIAFDRGRNLAPIVNNAPNDRDLRVSFANAGGLLYTVVFSITGSTPSFRLPDGRLVPITPDTLTGLTLAGPVPPLITNNVNRLDATGRSVVSLNLNALGNAVNGIRLWAVGVVFDPNAPLGIAQISAPTVIVL